MTALVSVSMPNQTHHTRVHRHRLSLGWCVCALKTVMAMDGAAAATRSSTEDALTRVVDLGPGKDFGVVAVCIIPSGSILFREAPLLRLVPDGEGRYDGTYGLGGDRDRCASCWPPCRSTLVVNAARQPVYLSVSSRQTGLSWKMDVPLLSFMTYRA